MTPSLTLMAVGVMAEAGLRKRDERIKRLEGLLRRAAVWLGCLANEHPELRRPRELRDAICDALNMPIPSMDKPTTGG